MKKIILAVAFSIFILGGAMSAAEEGLVGVWKWEERGEEDGETRNYLITLTFSADGAVKMDGVVKAEPSGEARAAETAYGNYEADGRALRIVITKVVPLLKNDDSGSEEGDVYEMVVRDDKLVTKFLGGEMVFERVK